MHALTRVAALGATLAFGLMGATFPALAETAADGEWTTIEFEDNAAMTLNPLTVGTSMADGWVRESEGMSSNSAHLKTSKVGATITYTFEGTGVKFLTKKGSGAGVVQVELFKGGDASGTALVTQDVDEYVPGAPQFKSVAFEKAGLVPGTYTIKLTTRPGDRTNYNFDALHVKPIPPDREPAACELDGDHIDVQAEGNSVQRSGDWRIVTGGNSTGSLGGGHIYAPSHPASVALPLANVPDIPEGATLRGIKVFTKSGAGAGIAAVKVDNTEVARDDQYQAQAAFARDVLTYCFREALPTQVSVTTTGEKNASSRGVGINVDAIRVYYTAPTSPDIATRSVYYVDSAAVDESGDGSEERPLKTLEQVNALALKAGDRVLFKRGGSWTGQLYPKGSGEEGNPITIAAYGAADTLPVIDGGGRFIPQPAYGTDGPLGQSGSAVYLHNQSHWVISQLKVTNKAGDHCDEWGQRDNRSCDKERSGIRVEASGGGVYRDIVIRENVIDGVRGYNGQDSLWDRQFAGGTFFGSRSTHRSSGIALVSYTSRENNAADKTKDGRILDSEETRFDNVRIEDNQISNIMANGIVTTNVKGTLDDVNNRHTNVRIVGNTISRVTRSGIIPLYTNGALVERNVIDTFQATILGYGCGIWADRANNNLWQHNVVRNGQNTNDGMAFNLDDMTRDNTIQHNYTYNNVGGGYMLHVRAGSYNRNNTIRYNLSVNDTKHFNPHQAIVVAVGENNSVKIESAKVYNNTFINHNRVHPVFKGDQVAYRNNIFYLTDPGVVTDRAFDEGPKSTFENNLIAGQRAPERLRLRNIEAIDPGFVGNLDGTEAPEVALAKAKLISTSPAIKKARTFDGFPPSGVADLWNMTYDQPRNIGAWQGEEAAERTEQPPTIDTGEPAAPQLPECANGMTEQTVEAEDERVASVGEWKIVDNSPGHGGSHTWSVSEGASKTLKFSEFEGKKVVAVQIVTKSGAGAGIAEVHFLPKKEGGEAVAIDDQYAATPAFNKIAYTGCVPDGSTGIEITATGRQNPSATGKAFNIDYFRVWLADEEPGRVDPSPGTEEPKPGEGETTPQPEPGEGETKPGPDETEPKPSEGETKPGPDETEPKPSEGETKPGPDETEPKPSEGETKPGPDETEPKPGVDATDPGKVDAIPGESAKPAPVGDAQHQAHPTQGTSAGSLASTAVDRAPQQTASSASLARTGVSVLAWTLLAAALVGAGSVMRVGRRS